MVGLVGGHIRPLGERCLARRVLTWQLERPLVERDAVGGSPDPPALELCRALAESLCQVLAKCWRAGLEAVVRATFVLFSDFTTYSEGGSTPSEAQVCFTSTLGLPAVFSVSKRKKEEPNPYDLQRGVDPLLFGTSTT